MLGGVIVKVKEYRVKYSYTQKEFAELFGIKQNTYSDKERNKSPFTIYEIKILKELLNVTYDELLC